MKKIIIMGVIFVGLVVLLGVFGVYVLKDVFGSYVSIWEIGV